MRGTLLLLEQGRLAPADVDLLRANGLIVHQHHDLAHALNQFQQITPDVVVVASDRDNSTIVTELRSRTDHATSIIVASSSGDREAVRTSGADSLLPDSATSADLLDEIHRALILRRSGRRLSWR